VAVATGEVKDRISVEFLARWDALAKIRQPGLKSKLRLIFSRYGLPTSNRRIVKQYAAELRPRALRVGKELYDHIGVERGDVTARNAQWANNYKFFGAPVEMFIFIHKSLHVFAASDAGLMMQNLMLSAHARGLGTCAQGAVNIWDDVIRQEFNISKDYRLLCGLALGYPSDAVVNTFGAHRIGVDELVIKPTRASK
jgi:nitroreductase